jgi:hypothetical protein
VKQKGRLKLVAAGGFAVCVLGWASAVAAQTAVVDCGSAPALGKPVGGKARFTILADGAVAFDASVEKPTLRLQVPTKPMTCTTANGAAASCSGVLRVDRVRAGVRTPLVCGAVTADATYEVPGYVDDWSLVEVGLYGIDPTGAGPRADRAAAIVRRLQERFEKSRKEQTSTAVTWWTWALKSSVAGLLGTLPDSGAAAVAAKDGTTATLNAITLALLDKCAPPLDAQMCVANQSLKDLVNELKVEVNEASPNQPKIGMLLENLRVPPKPTAPKEYCEALSGLKALTQQDKVLKLVAAQLPSATRVLEVAYANGMAEHQRTNKNTPLGVLINNVPQGLVISTPTRSYEAKQASVADVLATFLPFFIRATAAADKSEVINEACVDTKVPDMGSETVAAYESRGVVLPPGAGTTTELQVCEGDKCVPDGATPTVRNTVTIKPPNRWRLGLFLDFSGNYGKTLSGGHDAFSEPGYEALNGDDNLSEAFVLHRQSDVRRNIMLSLLIGPRSDRFAFAFGPGLVDASGSDAFRQWHLRLGIKVAENLFVTVGGGARFIQEPEEGAAGALVLTRTPDTHAKTPTLQTETGVAVTGGVGLALDLSVLSDAGEKLLKSVGGKQ